LRKLKRIYRDYLRKIGKLEGELSLGKRGDSCGVENEDVLIRECEFLRKRLESRFHFSNKILILAMVLLCILFALGVYLIFYFRDDPPIRGGIFAGTFISLLSIVKWLHVIWKEKIFIDISIAIFEELSPSEAAQKAAEFIPLLYKRFTSPPKTKVEVNVEVVEEKEKKMETVKEILILASNPKTTPKFRLDEEVREIQEGLQRSKHRSQFQIQSRWAIRLRDLRRALLDVEPQIVHFTGHGKEDGLLVEDELGMAVRISTKALKGLFELCASHVECVILSACYSAPQAAVISKHIHYVIGMKKEIKDKAAIEFAVGFYDAIGAGKPFEEAFEFGCNAIQLYNLPDHLVPVLKKKS